MLSKTWKRFGKALLSGALSATIITTGTAAGPAKDAKGKDIVPGELIVKFKADATDAQIQHGLKLGHLKVKKHKQTEPMKARGHNGVTLVETALGVDDAVAQLKNHPAMEYVEPNYTYKHQLVSNDTYVTNNYTWGLYSGTSKPANVYGSGAIDAWAAGHVGTNSVYVAVIDEGIDVAHPDLAPNMWVNSKDPVDGVDNDGNGYVDDMHGWNFYGGNNQVFDSTGDTHGTHVAGTIGAKGGNGKGVAGVNWNVTILSGKFLGPDGGDTFSAVEAIDYFIDLKKRHGINLVAINASWGGGGYSQSLHDSIIRAAKAGIIFCAAAGNDGLNNDFNASYPSNSDTTRGTSTETAASFNGVIAVAAIDRNGALASFSNYGARTVHIGAPGVDILSCYPNLQLGHMSGTSMAAPHVTGAIALYAAVRPADSPEAIRTAILGGGAATPSVIGKTITGSRLNISAMPPFVATPVCTPPSDAVAVPLNSSQIHIDWVDNSADETGFKVFRKANAGSYVQVTTIGANVTGYTDSGLAGGVQYSYKVCATATTGDSTFSNETTTTTAPYAPINLAVIIDNAGQVQFTWKDNSVNETGFKIFRRVVGGVHSQVAATAPNVSLWKDSAATPGVRYYYTVCAVGMVVNSGFFTEVTIVAGTPALPSSLVATPLNSSQIKLTWTDNASNETGVKVFRASPTGIYSPIATLTANATSYTDVGLAGGMQYSYKVISVNDAGDSAFSNSSSSTTAPYAPVQLAVAASSATEVHFTWKDNSVNETGFKVFRRVPGGPYSQIATVGPNAATWLDFTVLAGTRYYYTVCASGPVIDSGFFTEVSVATPATLQPLF